MESRLLFFARSILILVAATLSVGCASIIRTEAVLSSPQERIYRDGVAAIISKKNLIVVMSGATSVHKSEERSRFIISVSNPTNENFELDTTNITLTVNKLSIPILTHNEVVAEIKRKEVVLGVLTALSGAANSYSARLQASNSSFAGTYRSSTYGASNSTTTGSFSGSVYNPWAGQVAAASVDAQTDAQIAAIQGESRRALQVASQTILKRTTVTPLSSYGGHIVLGDYEIPDNGAVLQFRVSIAGEVHEFLFTQYKQAK